MITLNISSHSLLSQPWEGLAERILFGVWYGMLTSEPSEQYWSCHAGSGTDGTTIATVCWSTGSLAVAAALGSGVETRAHILWKLYLSLRGSSL